METKLVSWSLIILAIVLVALDLTGGAFGLLQLALPSALLALGVDLLGKQSSRKVTLVLAVVAAVLAVLVVVRRVG